MLQHWTFKFDGQDVQDFWLEARNGERWFIVDAPYHWWPQNGARISDSEAKEEMLAKAEILAKGLDLAPNLFDRLPRVLTQGYKFDRVTVEDLKLFVDSVLVSPGQLLLVEVQ